MSIVVLKFGGTSLRSANKENHFLSHIENSINNNERPVIVVSAIGRKGEPYATDTLIEELEKISEKIDPQKKDLIMSCGETISAAIVSHLLDTRGIPSEPFMGIQAGIITDDNFNFGNILNIDSENILDTLDKGIVPVIAGFQGATQKMKITTLGRGGSDITAVTLGGYLDASRVDIFTDVAGVAFIDPSIIPQTKYIDKINYDDMYTLASNGVNVIHPKAVKLGKKFGIPIQIRSTFLDKPGTLISDFQIPNSIPVVGIAIESKITTNVITIVFNKNFDYHDKKKFEKYLLKDEIFLETIWYHGNKLAILLKFDDIDYFCNKIYKYFFS